MSKERKNQRLCTYSLHHGLVLGRKKKGPKQMGFLTALKEPSQSFASTNYINLELNKTIIGSFDHDFRPDQRVKSG